MKVNENYSNLKENYLFATVSSKVAEFKNSNPHEKIIYMGIGDVTKPLCSAVINNLNRAVEEMANENTFRGYGPYEGYDFLREAVSKYYLKRNIKLQTNEIFISDGAKSDCGNILNIFGNSQSILIPDPVYPVYVDTNIMAGNRIFFANADEHNEFLPLPGESVDADVIYICSPNNPTGAAYNKEQLKKWVDYANAKDAIILFDAAYEAFITDPDLPRSIFEINGAKTCAIEICSLSKTAGFTGTRCGYTVIPKSLVRGGKSLNDMWLRRQTTNFNGVSYIIQRGAEAVFTDEGQRQIKENLTYYKRNAEVISKAMDDMGIWYTGGKNSPYIWLKCPDNMNSWKFFDLLLNKIHVVGTPGCGFGNNGRGFFRLTAFGNYEDTVEGMSRLKSII